MTDESPTKAGPATNWAEVRRASSEGDKGSRRALDRLLRRYLPVLRSHLLFKLQVRRDWVDDLLQGFIADKILEQRLLAHADESRGKFRTFLLTALQNYVISVIRRSQAMKRSPADAAVLDIHMNPDAAATLDVQSTVSELDWARGVLAEALRRMESYCEKTKRPDVWGVFENRILAPILEWHKPMPYGEIMTRYGFRSPAQAANVLITAKRMFERFIRTVIAEYMEEDGNVESEIAELKAILACPHAESAPELRNG